MPELTKLDEERAALVEQKKPAAEGERFLDTHQAKEELHVVGAGESKLKAGYVQGVADLESADDCCLLRAHVCTVARSATF